MNIKHIKKYLPLLILAALIVAAYVSGLHESLNLTALQEQKLAFQSYTENHPTLSAIAFTGTYILAVALSLPIATMLTLLGGFLFGKWLGTLLVVTGATIGASIIFMVAKTSLGETLREKAGVIYKKIESNMQDNAINYMLFMRLAPIFPFVLVNIVPALFNVSLRAFMITTFFGIIPGSFVFVNVGQELGDIENIKDIISTDILLAFALLGLFALIPTIYKQIKARKLSAGVLLFSMALGMTNPAQASDYNYDRFLGLYDELLKTYVQPARYDGTQYNAVNYAAWADNPKHKQALDIMLKTNPDDFKTQQDRLAFWINSYNFLTIDLIVTNRETETIKNLGGFLTTPWKKHQWMINGSDYNLDHIEHNIIRKFGDARIHFAINCAAISCPDLRNEAYRAEKLDRQLENQVELSLLNGTKGLLFNKSGNTVTVTKVMDWFAEDFNNGDLKGWLEIYRPAIINEETTIGFFDYNWSLNSFHKGT